MISRYEATLNGVNLSSIDDKIIILDVNYLEPEKKFGTFQSAQRDGARIHNRYKPKASVSISFAIRAYDIAERQEICQKVNAWARNGGTLVINDRPEQFLACECESLASVQSVRNWTDAFQLVFSAYNCPYWQDIVPTTLTMNGTTGSGSINVPGSAKETYVEATISTPYALNTIILTVGNTSFTLTGLGLSSGAGILIQYDSEMILSIKTGNVSLLNKRTGSDDLIANCGVPTNCSFTANVTCAVTFSARGLWE